MPRIFITAVSASVILGCFIALLEFPLNIICAVFTLCVFLALCIPAIHLRRSKKVILLCVCGIALVVGICRVTVTDINQDHLVRGIKSQVFIEGVVTGDVEDRETYSRYTVKILNIDGLKQEKKRSILVYEPYPTKCIAGEKITFFGQLNKPENFLGSGGRVFHYEQYLRQFGIYAIAFIQKSSCSGERKNHEFFSGLRKRLVDAMSTFLPTRETSLLSGLVLGLRGSFSPELLEVFRITGLIHIIVLSGYNVTLIAEAVRRLFAWAPRTLSFFISLMTVVVFVMLAGAQVTAIRAGSMATIALIARTTHREYDGIRALMLVAAIMTLYNPNQVLLSVSFHLSFLATLGLLIFSPIIERIFRRLPEKFEIRGIISSTLAVQITLLPYLAYAIGEISIIGIPANIFILPIIPIAMLFGSAVTIVAVLSPAAAVVISPIAYLPLRVIIFLAETLSHIPKATIVLPKISALWTVAATTLLLYIGHRYKKHRKRRNTEERSKQT